MAEVVRPPITDSRMSREVNGNDVARLQHSSARTRHSKVASQIDLRSGVAKVVAHPAGPMKEVRIVTRESEKENHGLHHRLLHSIHERRVRAWVRPIGFLCQNEWRVWQRPVQLDDARATTRWQITSGADNGVWAFRNLLAGGFEERVPIRGKDIAPWHLEKALMKWSRKVIGISDHVPEDLIQLGLSALYLVLLSQSFRRRTTIQIVRVELPMKLGRDVFEHRHRRPVRPFGPCISTEPAAHHDRCSAASSPQCLGDVIHTELVWERHVSDSWRRCFSRALRFTARE